MGQLELIEPAFDWTDEDIERVHLGMLSMVASHINDPHVSKKQLIEDLEWVAEDPLPHNEFLKSIEKRQVKSITFQACCYFAGFDVRDAQEAFFTKVKELGLDKVILSDETLTRVKSKVAQKKPHPGQASLF